jgi:hypothetical protein
MASLIGGFLLVFNVGQTVNDKIKLLNAADAAAYSAAIWEARSLNYQAYMNRAIVANEVAIAQLVSLRSWSTYVDRTLGNASLVTSWIPPLAAPMRALSQGWGQVDRGVQQGLPLFESGLSRWNVDVLSVVQAIAQQQAPIAAADLVTQVATANEPRAQVSAATRIFQVRNGAQWQSFTARYQRGGGDLNRFVALLMSSRDGFTQSRRGDLLPSASPVQISRRGGTDLLGEYSWRGVDTLSVHIELPFISEEVPVGWGAAEQRRLPVGQRGVHGGSLRRNPRASRIALRTVVPRQQYRGVPEIRDVTRPTRQDDRRLRYSVALSIPKNSVLTADEVVVPQGLALFDGSQLSAAPSYAADAIHALGTAEVYFQRPTARRDRRQEYPNLFSPYWQARLVEVSAADRTLSAPSRGLGVDPYAVLR